MPRRIYRANRSIVAVVGEGGLLGWRNGVAYFSKEPIKPLRWDLEDEGFKIVVGRLPRTRKRRRKKTRR